MLLFVMTAIIAISIMISFYDIITDLKTLIEFLYQ
ncbi:hypothetical protein CLV62_11566 [Dysgonomonas alginatilytica]|uniref:Uncharacterized protein n=1 Tax=Dysgonomonas alginatilytica TaxID=1605892 RepID=A0A2V3PMA2_9BACT|nr:hypothetical protein CLV62_11566 [Dysgonomonas alginatilytica]